MKNTPGEYLIRKSRKWQVLAADSGSRYNSIQCLMFKRLLLIVVILILLAGLAVSLVPSQYLPADLQIYPQIIPPRLATVVSYTRDSLFRRLTETGSHTFVKFDSIAGPAASVAGASLLGGFEKPLVQGGWARQESSRNQWLMQQIEQLPTASQSGVDNNRLRLILTAIIEKGQMKWFVAGMGVEEVKALVAEDLREDVTAQSLAELRTALQLLPSSTLGRNFDGQGVPDALTLLSQGDLRIVSYTSPAGSSPKAVCYAAMFTYGGKPHLAVSAETVK